MMSTLAFNKLSQKKSFNLDPSKQARIAIFIRKIKEIVHPSIFFANNPVQQVSSHKHLYYTHRLILHTS